MNKIEAAALAAKTLSEALAAHTYCAAQGFANTASAEGGHAPTAVACLRRVGALRPLPESHWERAAEDLLVLAIKPLLPQDHAPRLRRLCAVHVAATSAVLRAWKAQQ